MKRGPQNFFMKRGLDVLLEARMGLVGWDLFAVDIWVDVLPEARVGPVAWNLVAVDIWVDVLLEAEVRPGAGDPSGSFSLKTF